MAQAKAYADRGGSLAAPPDFSNVQSGGTSTAPKPPVARYIIDLPDGSKYEIEDDHGKSEAELMAEVLAFHNAPMRQQQQLNYPTQTELGKETGRATGSTGILDAAMQGVERGWEGLKGLPASIIGLNDPDTVVGTLFGNHAPIEQRVEAARQLGEAQTRKEAAEAAQDKNHPYAINPNTLRTGINFAGALPGMTPITPTLPVQGSLPVGHLANQAIEQSVAGTGAEVATTIAAPLLGLRAAGAVLPVVSKLGAALGEESGITPGSIPARGAQIMNRLAGKAEGGPVFQTTPEAMVIDALGGSPEFVPHVRTGLSELVAGSKASGIRIVDAETAKAVLEYQRKGIHDAFDKLTEPYADLKMPGSRAADVQAQIDAIPRDLHFRDPEAYRDTVAEIHTQMRLPDYTLGELNEARSSAGNKARTAYNKNLSQSLQFDETTAAIDKAHADAMRQLQYDGLNRFGRQGVGDAARELNERLGSTIAWRDVLRQNTGRSISEAGTPAIKALMQRVPGLRALAPISTTAKVGALLHGPPTRLNTALKLAVERWGQTPGEVGAFAPPLPPGPDLTFSPTQDFLGQLSSPRPVHAGPLANLGGAQTVGTPTIPAPAGTLADLARPRSITPQAPLPPASPVTPPGGFLADLGASRPRQPNFLEQLGQSTTPAPVTSQHIPVPDVNMLWNTPEPTNQLPPGRPVGEGFVFHSPSQAGSLLDQLQAIVTPTGTNPAFYNALHSPELRGLFAKQQQAMTPTAFKLWEQQALERLKRHYGIVSP